MYLSGSLYFNDVGGNAKDTGLVEDGYSAEHRSLVRSSSGSRQLEINQPTHAGNTDLLSRSDRT